MPATRDFRRREVAASELPLIICHFQTTPTYLVLCTPVYSKISLSNMQQQQCLQQGRRREVAASVLPILSLYSVIWFILRSF